MKEKQAGSGDQISQSPTQCEECSGLRGHYSNCSKSKFKFTRPRYDAVYEVAMNKMDGAGGTNPSDRDIDTLVRRICAMAHDWNEGIKPLDREKIKACIIAWHIFQEKQAAEPSPTRPAEPSNEAELVNLGDIVLPPHVVLEMLKRTQAELTSVRAELAEAQSQRDWQYDRAADAHRDWQKSERDKNTAVEIATVERAGRLKAEARAEAADAKNSRAESLPPPEVNGNNGR